MTAAPPDPDFWAHVRALFADLLDMPPGPREAALMASHATDDVKREVRSLLAHAADDDLTGVVSGAGSFLA